MSRDTLVHFCYIVGGALLGLAFGLWWQGRQRARRIIRLTDCEVINIPSDLLFSVNEQDGAVEMSGVAIVELDTYERMRAALGDRFVTLPVEVRSERRYRL